MTIRTVIRAENGMVMVFDEGGEQVPEYQGKYEDVKERILKDATPDVLFNHWHELADRPQVVSKEDW